MAGVKVEKRSLCCLAKVVEMKLQLAPESISKRHGTLRMLTVIVNKLWEKSPWAVEFR